MSGTQRAGPDVPDEVLTNRKFVSHPKPLCGPSCGHLIVFPDAAVILSCPFPAKFGLSIAIPGHFFKVDKSGSSASADEIYLIVNSIAIIIVHLRFLFVMVQRSTRRSTMRREVHEEKCGVL